jgi:rare lipoprotein A (peptidoglycan hydrolase)
VPASDAGRHVVIERNGHETGWTWEPTVSTTAQSDGSFSATWNTNHIGRFSIRVVITTGPSTATAAAASPAMTVTVYRSSIATLYGPGFWGRRTACGKRLTRSTIGVANRTLKCGEDVALYYQGKTLIVPVIDRGPYANNADWDLTMATGKALGIEGTTKLGAVSLPPQPGQ